VSAEAEAQRHQADRNGGQDRERDDGGGDAVGDRAEAGVRQEAGAGALGAGAS
jgi:hypothetical protein